jgi:hypothetical protein
MSNDAIRIPGGPSSWAVILEPILLQQVSGLSVVNAVKEINLWKSTDTRKYAGEGFPVQEYATHKWKFIA